MGMKARPRNNVFWVTRDPGEMDHVVAVWAGKRRPRLRRHWWGSATWKGGGGFTEVCVRQFRKVSGLILPKGTAQQFEFTAKAVGKSIVGKEEKGDG